MRLLACILAAALSVPISATALSCARPDVRRAYQAAARSPETYIVVFGKLDFDPARLPGKPTGSEEDMKLSARLTGRAVTRSGFSAWLDRRITIEVRCVSVWCGSIPRGKDMLMFLRQSGAGYSLDVGPCPGFAFPNPDGRMLRQVRACLSGASCQPGRN